MRALTTRAGSLLIDILLATAIFGLIVSAFSSGIIGGQQGTLWGGNRARATYLAEEGLEAVRSIRDQTNGFALLAARPVNQSDGVRLVGSGWTIVESPTLIDGIFTRSITWGSGENAHTRSVISRVQWTESVGKTPREVSLSTIFTNWHTSLSPPVDWTLACIESVAAHATESNFIDVIVDGNYAYVTGDSLRKLFIFDITDLNNPQVVDEENVNSAGTGLHDLAKKDSFIYIANGHPTRELTTIDVSTIDPGTPAPLDWQNLNGTAGGRGLIREGDTLYLTREGDGAPGADEYMEFDVTVPGSPSEIAGRGVNMDDRSGFSITRRNGYAYLGTTSTAQELTVVDGNASPPVNSGGGDTGNGTNGVSTATRGNVAYLGTTADFPYQLYAFDIGSSPGNPPAPGGSAHFDVSPDTRGEVRDIAVSSSPPVAFLATDAWASGGNEWWYFQVVDLSYGGGLDIAGRRIAYLDMLPAGRMPDATDGAKGIAFRSSDNTVFLVGGKYFVVIRPGGCT